jgi:hypothetical protein
MHKITHTTRGVALLLVLMLIAVASVVGLAYLYSATVKTAGTQNLLSGQRAGYLAESGLQHAIYVVHTDDTPAAGSPWGPYSVDDAEGEYTFSISEDSQTSGLFHVSSTGTVGGVSQTYAASILLKSCGYIDLEHVVLVGSGDCLLPASADLTGNVHGNGNVYVLGTVVGDVSATGSVEDWGGGVTGSLIPGADYVPVPSVSYQDYINYVWYGDAGRDSPDISGTAIEKVTGLLVGGDPLCNGGSITSENPGGVVHLVPSSGTEVQIGNNVDFQGTLVIDGDLVLGGGNITLKAQSNFPAIVASGQVIIDRSVTANIEGMIIADGGVAGDGHKGVVTVTGGLLTQALGMSDDLRGTQTVNYDASRCHIYNFGSGGSSVVTTD